ncbi:MAG: hypothetical protein JWR80_9388 [Bradyrhizobium sp.]|nr:hypothetical protein [Bradyrhizobium sp.]
MTPALRKLIEIGGPPFAPTSSPAGKAVSHLGDIGASIGEVLAAKNGFFCFESALRVFPSASVDSSCGLAEWNSPGLWKADYRGIADNIFCFAEEILGRQFVIHEDKIAVFEPETAELEIIASSLEEWASKILLDYRQMTGHVFAHAWQSVHGPLHPRHRLMARTPFVLGGAFSIENFAALDSVQMMKSLGNLAFQLRDLPDGTKVQFRILQ